MQQALKGLKSYVLALRDLVYPRSCPGCGASLLRNERVICIACNIALPINPFINLPDNEITRVFSGRLPLRTANTLLYFSKNGIAQQLIHKLKYEDREDIGLFLGNLLGSVLNDTMPEKPNLIIPVPLHPDKEALRGYNQCHSIALGLQQELGGEVSTDSIIRVKANPSQTKLNRVKRWDNVKGIFEVIDANQLESKHVLLVDDTLTTGATLESCGSAILQAKNTSLSIATVAYAS